MRKTKGITLKRVKIVLKEINDLKEKKYTIIKVFDPADENIISEMGNLFHSEWTYSFHDDKPKLINPKLRKKFKEKGKFVGYGARFAKAPKNAL